MQHQPAWWRGVVRRRTCDQQVAGSDRAVVAWLRNDSAELFTPMSVDADSLRYCNQRRIKTKLGLML